MWLKYLNYGTSCNEHCLQIQLKINISEMSNIPLSWMKMSGSGNRFGSNQASLVLFKGSNIYSMYMYICICTICIFWFWFKTFLYMVYIVQMQYTHTYMVAVPNQTVTDVQTGLSQCRTGSAAPEAGWTSCKEVHPLLGFFDNGVQVRRPL